MSGFVAAELRGFIESPQFREQFDGAQPSLILNPEFRYRVDEGVHRFSVIPFLRLDARDDQRTHFDLREAYFVGDRDTDRVRQVRQVGNTRLRPLTYFLGANFPTPSIPLLASSTLCPRPPASS